jgi:hypothetical protein
MPPSQPPGAGPQMSPQEAADYIAQMAEELKEIAEIAHFGLLTYFLDMARMEAEECARRNK